MDAGWYADPFGRFEHRWHDGTAWTEHVSSTGEAATDPPTPSPPAAGTLAVPVEPANPVPTVITPQVVVAVPPMATSSTVSTTVRIHTHRSVFWWIFIGWWYVPIKWLCAWPIVIYRRLTGRRPGDIKVRIDSQHDHRGGPG